MKKFLLLPLILLLLLSCKSIQREPICKEPIWLTGKVISTRAESKTLRTVLYETDNGLIVIFGVPTSANLVKIPVCFRFHQIIYFNKK